jgi:hypothetical protein
VLDVTLFVPTSRVSGKARGRSITHCFICLEMFFLPTVAEPRLLVKHSGSLLRPLLLGHRLIGNNIFSEHVLELLAVAPVLWIAIFAPKDCGSDIRRNVLDILGVYGFLAVRRHENLHRLVVIADGAMIERTHDALICDFLSNSWADKISG